MAKKPNKPFVPSNASTWNPEDGEENLVINNNGDLNIWLGREDLQEYHERKRLKQSSSAAEGSNTTEGSTQSSNTSESLKQSSDTTEDFVQSNSTEDSKQGSNAIENLKQSFYTTPVSKKAGNGNARRHGAYSNGLLPWESEEEFRALHEDLQKEWKPDGASEKELVLDLAQWRWKRRRALQGSQISYFRSPVPDQLKSGALSWDDVVEHQATVPKQVQDLIEGQNKLADSLYAVSNRIGDHYYWTNTTEGKDIQSALTKMKVEVHALNGRVRDQMLRGGSRVENAITKITNLFDQAYQPDEIEKETKLLAMIDRETEKTMRRLIYLKTFKDIESQKVSSVASRTQPLLESPPVTPNQATTLEDVQASENTPLRGTRTHPVALAAPEHRGLPKPE